MAKIATITGKRQITIPASIFREANLREGQQVLVSQEKGKLYLEPLVDLVEELAGSVKVPPRFKGMSLAQIIRKAKKEHFQRL